MSSGRSSPDVVAAGVVVSWLELPPMRSNKLLGDESE